MKDLIKQHAGWFQLLFVVGVVGSAVLLSVALKPEVSDRFAARAPEVVVVSVTEPVTAEYAPTVRLNGVVQARTVTDVIPEVGGRVIEVTDVFRPGGSFRQGDLLFRIDPADYKLAIEQTLAEIEAARSELSLLEAQSEAERKIWDDQGTGRKIPDLVAKVPQIKAAKARIHGGEAARAAAELSLGRTIVRAPFDGRVLETQLDVGQVVGAFGAVGRIFAADSLEISVPVSSEELSLLGSPVGLEATIFRAEAPGSALQASVVRQAAALDERTRLRTLYLKADEGQLLTLGEFVSVEISGQMAADVLHLPSAALTSRDQVWVVEDGALRERRVNVVGSEGSSTIVRNFDVADGVVSIPPANAWDGLAVTALAEGRVVGGGGSNPVVE